MGQGTECNDRSTEVSVIRFVSRNRTIEEIAPKKVSITYTCVNATPLMLDVRSSTSNPKQ